jgi:hypothetical protein
VANSTLEQRASRLGQYVTEAQWRHQLVSWTENTKEQKNGKSRKGARKYKQKLGRLLVGDEAEYASDEDDDKDKISGKELSRQAKHSLSVRVGNSKAVATLPTLHSFSNLLTN